MSAPAASKRRLAIAALIAWLATPLVGQSITVSTAGGVLRARAPAFEFIEGEILDRLRDGRSLRLDLSLTVFDQPRGAVVAQARQSFNLSFDLWEERFAVTRVGTPQRSVSHLRSREAEAWCLEHLTVPRADLGRLGRETPFWIRLEYRVPVEPSVSDSENDETFTLRRLIDVFSRRQRDGDLGRSVDAGPFRLEN